MYKIFQGNKRLNINGIFPLIVVAIQKEHMEAFAENHIFTGLDNPALLHDCIEYNAAKNIGQAEFDEFVTFESLLASQLNKAMAHLENSVLEKDKSLHEKVFLNGYKFDFVPVGDEVFFHLAINNKNKKEIATMFEKDNSQILTPLKKIVGIVSRMEIKMGQ